MADFIWSPRAMSLRGQLASAETKLKDRRAGITPLERQLRKFGRQEDPDGLLPPEERRERAKLAMDAHMLRMQLKAEITRQRKKAAKIANGEPKPKRKVANLWATPEDDAC